MEPANLRLGRGIVDVLEPAVRREWLLTDGAGGYAMGTVAGSLSRAYHGLLIAATEPPLGRTLLVGGLVEELTTSSGRTVALHSQRWADGAVDPRGFELLEAFELRGSSAVWTYALAGILLEKRVLMPRTPPATTLVVYTLCRAPDPGLRIVIRPLCTWRDHHAPGLQTEAPSLAVGSRRLAVRFPWGEPIHVRASSGTAGGGGEWHLGFRLDVETERGLADVQDLYAAGSISAVLEVGESLALSLSLDESFDPGSWRELEVTERARTTGLLERAGAREDPVAIRLVLAADQFVVARRRGPTVIAGYPWFGDWGRDTFIALPGLALDTGRPELSAGLLRAFAGHIAGGLLPNRFPDRGGAPEFNTADATLWYVEALRAHVEATGDGTLVDELWPVLEDIVECHLRGTAHGIATDPGDGLLRAGEPGVAVTWMDARIGTWVVTPRVGKPVEINALWHNALRCLAGWAGSRTSGHDYAALAERVATGFDRFWNPATGYCFDVVDSPAGDDPSVRPNAVIAAAVHHTPLSAAQVAAVVAVAERSLLTSMGLRSLSPDEPGYAGRYRGDVAGRDAAYHQGTVWPWLIGPFVGAHLRVHGDPAAARGLLIPLLDHIADAGLGSVSEIADGDAPHTPRGCPWQAWSVAAVLRAWRQTAPVAAQAPVETSPSVRPRP
jgi:predicted glycogen debranching enzyme